MSVLPALATALLTATAPQHEASGGAPATAVRDASHWIRELEQPERRLAAVRELVRLGPAALPALHKALAAGPPEIVPAALFACSGLPGDVESLREPIRRHLRGSDLGAALAARDALVALDGRGCTFVVEPVGKVASLDAAGGVTALATRPGVMAGCMLADAHVLLVDGASGRIVELDARGAETWSCGGFSGPHDAERLPNGNTLVADPGNCRVVEVDAHGNEVWCFRADQRPLDVDRLGNGNTLITSHRTGVVEVDRGGAVVWQWTHEAAREADRLPDGTTLVTLTSEQRVVRTTASHDRVAEWRLGGPIEHVDEADLLPNGNLLVAGSAGVVELDAGGREVWRGNVAAASRTTRLGARPDPPAGR